MPPCSAWPRWSTPRTPVTRSTSRWRRTSRARRRFRRRAVAEGLEDIAAERTYSRDEFRPQLHALRQRVRQQHGLPPLEVHEPEPAYGVAPVAKKAKRKRGG